MPIPQENSRPSKGGILHFQPKKLLARVGNFRLSVRHWLDQYPIGYADVVVRYGIKLGMLLSAIKRAVAKLS